MHPLVAHTASSFLCMGSPISMLTLVPSVSVVVPSQLGDSRSLVVPPYLAPLGNMRSLLYPVTGVCCVDSLPRENRYRGRKMGAFAQTIPMLTSGSRQPTFVVMPPECADRLARRRESAAWARPLTGDIEVCHDAGEGGADRTTGCSAIGWSAGASDV